jgi:hypothetical protein
VGIRDNYDRENNIGIPFHIGNEQTIISPSMIETAYPSKPVGMESARSIGNFQPI